MQRSEDLVEGTVYLVVDQYPDEGPDLYISGETAAMIPEDNSDGYEFKPCLVIGPCIGDVQYVDDWYMVSLEAHISQARLSSIAAAVQCGRRNAEVWPERIYIHNGEGPINHYLMDLDQRTYLEINSSRIGAYVEERYLERPSIPRDAYEEMVDSLASNYQCHALNIGYFDVDGMPIRENGNSTAGFISEDIEEARGDDYYANEVHVVGIMLVADDPDELAGRLIDCARAVHDYLAAIRGGPLDAKKIMSVLRGGHVDVLIGMQENAYLEIKSSRYNLCAPGQVADRQKIELAQDVARFANGDTDAILLIGYEEAKSKTASRISKIAPFNLDDLDINQYRAVLDSKIVPPITGLVIEKVQIDPIGNSGVLFIFVPRQPDEMQPYLVHGSIVAGKVEGAFFSIVQRRGEASITLTASHIHGYIVAGKAFLRGSK